jgi:hypothetical protein
MDTRMLASEIEKSKARRSHWLRRMRETRADLARENQMLEQLKDELSAMTEREWQATAAE